MDINLRVTKSFIISLDSVSKILGAMLVEHQGYRGITLDPRLFQELTCGITANVVSIIMSTMDPKYRHTLGPTSTSSMVQGCADALTYAVNSYGIGKQLPDSVAIDMINRLEREVISLIATYLP